MPRYGIRIPVEVNGKPKTTQYVNGRFYRLTVAGRVLRIMIDANGTVSDVRSGYRIGDVGPIKVERMARISTYTKTIDRQAAVILIDRIVDAMGPERFWAVVDAAPALNA